MGRHSKKSRITYRLTGAAIPALASAGMVICLSPQQALASTSTTHSATSAASTVDAAFQLGHAPAPTVATVSAVRQAAARPAWYTVRQGDSLSTIAKRFYHNSSAWPVLYWANRSNIRWANVIAAGQKLRIPVEPSKIPAAPSLLGPQAPPALVQSTPTGAVTATVDSTYSGGAPGGSFGACVIARESGGNSQVMNSTGHYGLYQFSASTWAEYGGSAADFGNASVAEQNAVFANALAAGGQSNWSAYDGC